VRYNRRRNSYPSRVQNSYVPEAVKKFHDKVIRTPKGKGLALPVPSTANEKNYTWPDNLPNKHLKYAYEYAENNDPFSINNRILSLNAPRTSYRRRNSDGKSVIHWGQRKLLLSEIEFLTLYGDLSSTVVYAGAAPGSHITKLSDMFPDLKFILYDPNDFDPKLKSPKYEKKIEIVQKYFLDETAKKFENDGVLFISDIRTANWHKMKEEDVQERVREDNKWMKDWVLLMKPKKAMLKFKVPYPEKPKSQQEIEKWLVQHGVPDPVLKHLQNLKLTPVKLRALSLEDILKFDIPEDDKTLLHKNILELRQLGCSEFLSGDIHLPVWGPVTTTETRLVTNAEQPLILYDHTDYEELMFHFNTLTRMTYYPHDIPTNNTTGYDHCFDCRAEIWVLEQYLKRVKKTPEEKLKEEILEESKEISKELGHQLDTYVHRVYDDD